MKVCFGLAILGLVYLVPASAVKLIGRIDIQK
jgi:hypothetical protein